VLRELEYAARTQKAAASRERARQPARQDTPETRERMGAQLIEQEEREQAAQAKVRVAPSSIGLHSVQLGQALSWVLSDAAFLSHG
jgi:hypothetical protein